MRFTPLELVKLPRWAQHRIAALEADLAHAKKTRGQVESKSTRVSMGYEDPIYLPNETFDFRLGDRWEDTIHVKIRSSEDGLVLDISGSNSAISVHPEAANHITVKARR